MKVEELFHHRGGVGDNDLLDAIKQAVIQQKFTDEYVKDGTLEKIFSDLGFSQEYVVWKKGQKKLKISGKMDTIGLIIWFGNQHYSFKHFTALQLLFKRKEITRGIYITSTKIETVRRNRLTSLNKGRPDPGSSTRNYSEFESLRDFLEGAGDGIDVPITVVGISKESTSPNPFF